MDRAIEAGGHKVPGHYQTKVDHLIRIERTDEALRLLETANYQCPRNALLLVRQIELLVKIGSFDRAMKLSNHALMQCGLDPDLLRMAASVKIQNGYPMDAMTNLQQALKARPKDASLYFMLGSCFLRMERFQDAFDCYLKVREFEPNNPRSFFAPAAVLLQSGEFEKGWAAYEARIEMDKFKSAISNIKHLLWQGESLDEKTLLVHTEQGFGDSFQFCRYLPVLRKHIGPKAHLVFLCEPETKRLMQSLDGPDEVLCYGDKSEVEYDYQVPLLSLPARLGTIRETIPNRIPYLSVNSAIEEETPYLSNIEGRKKVAVVWAGRPTHADDKYRSIPFEIFRELLDQEGVDFYPLQWGERAQDIVPMFETHNHIKDCRDGIKDFADTAARLLQMDLLITVDTSVAHLAGALGVPTWVMLPFGSEWRWLRVGDKSQWYPEMRLYRQHILADWLSVFARVKRDLSEFTNWDE